MYTLTQSGQQPYPANDNFSSATTISGTSGAVAGSNVRATNQSPEPLVNSYSTAAATVWWRWTAPVSGTATFSTVGSAFDTLMGVYTGSSLSSLSLLQADDDRGANQTSICSFPCTSGRTYYICVGGYRGANGAITLRWSTVPSPTLVNDNFSSATTISGTSGVVAGSNVRATNQSPEPLVNSYSTAAATVWWRWTAPVSGTATFSTVGSAFDTLMGVYTGSSLSSLTLVKADDDRGANMTSICSFACTSGRTYYICVGGYRGANGAITLRWSTVVPQTPVNDNFANATLVSGLSGSLAGSNVGMTLQSGEPLLRSYSTVAATAWWKWTAPVTGTATFSTVGSAFDTLMGVYTGSSLSSLTLLKADDDRGANLTSICSFACTSGRTYYICVGGYRGATGSVTLRWSTAVPLTPANDNFANATFVSGTSGSVSGSNVRATSQSGEPLLNGYSTATTTVWWKWTAPGSGTATFSTVGSAFDTQMGIYTGSSLSSLSLVQKDDDRGANLTSICSFVCTGGQTYYICVGGFMGASGAITLRWSFVPVSLTNDNFIDATLISGTSGTKAGTNVRATIQSSEPLLYSYPNAGTTVWWKWTAPANGTATFSTVGTSFDTVMGIYMGWSLSSLSLVKADDDRGANLTSICSFVCTRGQTYYICVGGYRGASNTITLRWSMVER